MTAAGSLLFLVVAFSWLWALVHWAQKRTARALREADDDLHHRFTYPAQDRAANHDDGDDVLSFPAHRSAWQHPIEYIWDRPAGPEFDEVLERFDRQPTTAEIMRGQDNVRHGVTGDERMETYLHQAMRRRIEDPDLWPGNAKPSAEEITRGEMAAEHGIDPHRFAMSQDPLDDEAGE